MGIYDYQFTIECIVIYLLCVFIKKEKKKKNNRSKTMAIYYRFFISFEVIKYF